MWKGSCAGQNSAVFLYGAVFFVWWVFSLLGGCFLGWTGATGSVLGDVFSLFRSLAFRGF